MPILTNDDDSASDSVPSRESITFAEQVPAGDNGSIAYTLPADATVERVQVRIYRGAETTLHITPRVERGSASTGFDLIPTEGKDYIDGDDDVFTFDVSESVHEGDKLVIDRDNTDSSYAHNYRVIVDVDYLGGVERVKSFAKGVLG